MAAGHLRSISLPSRSHPLISGIEEQLHKLKTSESSLIGYKLSGLKDLYDCIDDLLQLPLTQQTLSHEKQSQCAEEALDGSLRLLDMCASTRGFFSQMKESVQELELSLRRRRAGDTGLTTEVNAYMESRKKLNKVIYKKLRNLKRHEKDCRSSISSDNSDLSNMINMLKGAEEISLALFESILSFISEPKVKSKPSGWSFVSNILQAKRVSSEGKVEANEVEKIDAELITLKASKDINSAEVHNILKGLEALESNLQETEEELECVYRRLVKTRVSLLNVLNH
ncbi:uncharacterized protein LOC8289474 [Ricinus communis]|uniref:uncharacterized protein LOC8289474 n=1 Tax=Ricinus communis TaxID=3988 RepID=UPI00201AD5C6|nr:uncharacterized protein LOC8289474 [Ricinus communis]